jgi:hypothetical protein
LPLASSTAPGAHDGGGGATGTHAPLGSRNSPRPQGDWRVLQDFPSALTKRRLQQLSSGILV